MMIRTTTTTEAVCDRCGHTEAVELRAAPEINALRDGLPEGWASLTIANGLTVDGQRRGICPTCARQFYTWWYRQAKKASDIGGRESTFTDCHFDGTEAE